MNDMPPRVRPADSIQHRLQNFAFVKMCVWMAAGTANSMYMAPLSTLMMGQQTAWFTVIRAVFDMEMAFKYATTIWKFQWSIWSFGRCIILSSPFSNRLPQIPLYIPYVFIRWWMFCEKKIEMALAIRVQYTVHKPHHRVACSVLCVRSNHIKYRKCKRNKSVNAHENEAKIKLYIGLGVFARLLGDCRLPLQTWWWSWSWYWTLHKNKSQ